MDAPRAGQIEFLGWQRPALVEAASRLARLDGLGETLVVVPGGRAQRLLLALLVEECERLGVALEPPAILTPRSAAGELLGLSGPFAGGIERRLAWIAALHAAGDEALSAITSALPDDFGGWSALAGLIERAHDELAAELVDFGDAARAAAELPDAERWAALAGVQTAYLGELASRSRFDEASRRLESVRAGGRVERRVVLVATPDLPRAIAGALGLASDVRAWVHAPDSCADGFDAMGLVAPEYWRAYCAERGCGLGDDRIEFGEGPGDQAERAVAWACRLGAGRRAEEVVLCAPDEAVAGSVQRRADGTPGLRVRSAAGSPASDSAPVRLVLALAEYLERPDTEALAALVRHPDLDGPISAALGRGSGVWLDELDRAVEASGGRAHGRVVSDLLGALGPVIDGLSGGERPAHEWAGVIGGALASVYDTPERLEADGPGAERSRRACSALAEAIADLGACGGTQVSASRALRLVVAEAGGAALPERGDAASVEMLGWLEAAVDPAPVLVLAGMNEGAVPSARGADPLLPESLRSALGVAGASDRVGRDAYLLCAAVAGREEVVCVSGNRSADGDPIVPTRMLLMGPGSVERVRRFTDGPTPAGIAPARSFEPGVADLFTPVARLGLVARREPEPMSVTGFRDYLVSPYYFYLKHVQGLRVREEAAGELGAAAFGELIHEVLTSFARGPAKDERDEGELVGALMGELDGVVSRRFREPDAVLMLQVEAARARLAQVARWQSQRRAEGWQIVATEWAPEDGLFERCGVSARIRGRIDRVDRHQDGRLAVLDYKTGDKATHPEDAHGVRVGRNGEVRGDWTDLQLPLYRVLAGAHFGADDIELGYVQIPRQESEVGLELARWDEATLAGADETAAWVIERVRACEFGEIGDPPQWDLVGYLADAMVEGGARL